MGNENEISGGAVLGVFLNTQRKNLMKLYCILAHRYITERTFVCHRDDIDALKMCEIFIF